MQRLLLMIAGWLLTLAAGAQTEAAQQQTKKKKERKVELVGSVYDSFTKARLGAHLTLMTADSVVVDTMTCWTWGTNSFYQFKVPAVQKEYIIKGTCEGYEDGYLNYELKHIARNNYFELPRLLLKRKQQDDIIGESALDGVVVTGTKVKLAYRGDTLVYNASAFKLPQGSMLDGLIRQMPGAELKDNGDIYINGKKVDYLTLNGKDFFKGKNKVMLDNLPYFTVKELKVYNKSTRQSERLGVDVEKKDYVMDVMLKQEYNRGFMGNVEAGLGTDDRYMARLFSLYYDDHSRVSLWGNVNNVNENRQPGGEGEWTPANMPIGLRKTKQVGMSVSTEDKDKTVEEQFDSYFEWSDNNITTRTSTETFATDGNIFGGGTSVNKQNDFRFSLNNNLTLSKPYNINVALQLDYVNGRRNGEQQDSTYRDKLINERQSSSLNKYRTLTMGAAAWWAKKFYWGDFITVVAQGSLTRQKPSEAFSRNWTHYVGNTDDDLREYYNDTKQQQNNWTLQAGYTLQMLNQWFISAEAGYNQTHQSTWNHNFRLDWLGNLNGNQQHDLGWLPSTREVLMSVFDDNESDHVQRTERKYTGQLSVRKASDDAFISFELPVNIYRERMYYTDYSELDTIAHRHYTNIEPSIQYYSWNKKRGLSNASYRMGVTRPEFTSLMPGDDCTNPLAISISNPDLKPHIDHNANIGFTFRNDTLRRSLDINANATLVQQAWGMRTSYNPTTGGYTYRPDNIDGNWTAGADANYQRPLDKQKLLMLTASTNASYQHSVDFDILYTEEPKEIKSTVNNWNFNGHLKLEFQKGDLAAGVNGSINYRLSNSDRLNFQRINAFDYDYGMTLRYTIPWMKVNIATDIKMFSRRGYYSDLMNDDHLVWNAELTRSILKNKLTMKLSAFDLLHQLSNTQYSVNAQGRTETWQNSIPRYVMFTLAYKLTQTPKQK